MEGYGNENPGAFQSTRPLRGATLTGMTFREMFGISTHAPLAGRDLRHQRTHADERKISTHAPLAGRDVMGRTTAGTLLLFQPTRPLRGATGCCPTSGRSLVFQPTRPLRGATSAQRDAKRDLRISTHAPLAGRDGTNPFGCGVWTHFNPRAPCGARQNPHMFETPFL